MNTIGSIGFAQRRRNVWARGLVRVVIQWHTTGVHVSVEARETSAEDWSIVPGTYRVYTEDLLAAALRYARGLQRPLTLPTAEDIQ
jgi:hypothetical protein